MPLHCLQASGVGVSEFKRHLVLVPPQSPADYEDGPRPTDEATPSSLEYSDFEEVAKTHPLSCACIVCKIAGW